MEYEDQLRAILSSLNALMCALLHEWKCLHSTGSHSATIVDDDDDTFVAPFLLLMWASAYAHRIPRYHGTYSSIVGQWYIKPQSTIDWFNHFSFHAHADEERWREIFKLPLNLFIGLCNLVHEDVQQGDILVGWRNFPGRVFSVERKVAICVMVLASRNTHYHVANIFNCGRSTVTRFLHEFVRSLIHKGSHLIKWPTTVSGLQEIKDGFRAMRDLPNCCGTIDCTHINIDLPHDEQSKPWRDRCGNYSMILQGIEDAKMRFTDVNIGWPGSCSDKRVLRNSGLYRIGDGGYVLLPWLMIPFPRPQLVSQRHRNYNFMQSSTRIIVERAFGRLKRKWQILKGIISSPDLSRLPSLIYACCILHNMVVDIGVDDLVHEVIDIDLNDPLVDNPHVNEGLVEGEDTLHAITVRDDLMVYLDMQGLNQV
ncbi:hypothetical protein L7F22_061735 [Adiantum nelumboides]|nr:hypothetical protein [Adiantum nelumboides]